eukprot:1159864-Pelagomonas_calceolata.AAC.10
MRCAACKNKGIAQELSSATAQRYTCLLPSMNFNTPPPPGPFFTRRAPLPACSSSCCKACNNPWVLGRRRSGCVAPAAAWPPARGLWMVQGWREQQQQARAQRAAPPVNV